MEMTASTPPAAQRPVEELENDREFKAHVYQQLADLQPMLAPGCEISVLLSKEAEPKEGSKTHGEHDAANEVALTLVATFGDYRLEVEGRDENAYAAFGIAKRKIVDQLDAFYSTTIDSEERDAEIRGLMSGAFTLH